MVIGLCLFVMFVMLRYREIPLSRALSRMSVEPLARLLNRLDRRKLIFFLLIAAVLLFGGELLAVLGPLDMGLVLLWDVSLYVDALLGAAAVASVARFMPPLRFWRARPRTRRRRGVARKPVAGNDDDEGQSLRAA